jgi:hypothetical protein
MVLTNEPQGRRVENGKDKGLEVNIITIVSDQDFYVL